MNEILAYNPLAQISETFSWQTAVNPAWSAEERIALRDDPSLSITYSYAIGSDAKLADFYAFSETNLGIPIRIPMWSSPHFHSGSVLSAATSFSLIDSLLHYYLSPGDEVLLWKSATNFIALVISTISSEVISFTTSLGSNFSTFYILPLLTGRFNKAMNFTKGSGSRKRASFIFDVLNFVLPDPYAGYRVDKVLQSSEFSTATKQDREIVKSVLGIYENLPTSALIKESWKGGFNFASPPDLVAFLILLKSLKGRAVSFTFPYGFLSPTGTATVVLSSDSVTIEHTFPRRASASVELEGVPDPIINFAATLFSGTSGVELVIRGGVLYVGRDANPGEYDIDNTITKIDMGTGLPELTFSTGQLGNVKSDGTNIWVTDKHAVLYLYTGVFITLFAAGYWGEFCVYGEYIYALADGTLKKFDKLTGANATVIALSYSGYILADSTGVYSLNSASLKITALDLSVTEVVALPSVGSHIALTTTNIWVTGKPDKVYRINKTTKVVTTFTVSGLETSPYRDAYIQYLPDLGALVLSRALSSELSILNEVALSSEDLVLQTVVLTGQPREAVGSYVVTSTGIFHLTI